MNLRALTRGDAAVAGAAVLLLVSSFLPYVSVDCGGLCSGLSRNGWAPELFPVLTSVFVLGIASAALTLLFRLQGEAWATKQVLGLRLDQWGTALSVAALWTSLFSVLGGGTGLSHGIGAWLGLLSLLVLVAATAGGPLLPVLQAPLMSDKPPAPTVPQNFGQYPGAPGAPQPGQPGPYGYPDPAAQQQAFPAQQQPEAPQAYAAQQQPEPQPYGAHQPAGGYGFPQSSAQPVAAQAVPAPQPTAVQPAIQDVVPPQAAQPAAPFAPFWFAVPAVRQLANKDNPGLPPVGELVPGTWYLAVDQHGATLVAQLPDGTHGVLNDTSGIQRG
ncbi:hypothetical protein AB0K51_22670 [Kitasatospora sp. NPDC049285]|uniref:hypothetical protein n=1 Tax=Kitasatospora sp. NPDC049285 TaxID=3157096 RepID=UPI00343C3BD3